MMAESDYNRLAWQKLICTSTLPGTARLIALAISVFTDDTGTQGLWMSSGDIARVTGLQSMNTVNIHLRRLEEAGWLLRNDGARFLAWPGQQELRPDAEPLTQTGS